MPTPIGSIASQTASLTIAVFDASAAAEWVPTKPAATKAQFTGHPAEVMRGLAKGEEVAAVDVGASSGFAFELEGRSGRIDAYRAGTGLVLVAPPRAWWLEHHAEHAGALDAWFDELLAAVDDANEVGELELTSGKLLAVYMWLKKVGAARELATALPAGGAVELGDGYGDGNGGLIVDLGPGRYRLARHELAAPWANDQSVVAMYIVRD
ncbi:MAG: hypothetical protein ABI591_10005 [Kofleriaceae bacterium]